MGTLMSLILSILSSRSLILSLAARDFRSKYLGSYLGIFWAFVQPTVTVLIFWFVFQVGFKSMPVDDVPFILWLLAGMVPWFFISDSLNASSYAITDHAYLVKKMVFRVSLLPIVKIISALFIHLFFIVFLILMFCMYRFPVSVYYVQLPYYVMASLFLVLGVSLITSSLMVFLKDIGHVVGMMLQFGFWLTPIFWSLSMIPEQYHWLLTLNPVYYIVEGYRGTLIYQEWFWSDIPLMIYFWVFTFVIFGGGALLFKRLRPHFADVL